MQPLEANQCVNDLCELFPTAELTEAELGLFKSSIIPFDRADVVAAMQKHRVTTPFNRPTLQAIVEPLRGATRHQRIGVNVGGEQRLADVIRAQQGDRAKSMHDYEVILRYYRLMWR